MTDTNNHRSDTKTLEEQDEELLFKEDDRNSVLPIRYPAIWENYKKQAAAFWQAHEFTNAILEDKKQIRSLNEKGLPFVSADELHFIKMILAFFASSDLIVNKNLTKRFLSEVGIIEVQCAYAFQRMMENIHSETYALLIDAYSADEAEKEFLFNAVKNIPVIKKKAEWAEKWISSDRPFRERVAAFACVEGIHFSGAFCAIYWIKESNRLPGLTGSNGSIAPDEGKHTELATLVHDILTVKVTPYNIKKIVEEAVDLEIEFITEAIPCRLVGMNATFMSQYIKFVANRLLKQFGYDPIYPGVTQPFTFMDRISLPNKSNFFEHKPGEYQMSAQVDSQEDPFGFLD
jgi:ribonucleoside-diphosphate reductase beta chain